MEKYEPNLIHFAQEVYKAAENEKNSILKDLENRRKLEVCEIENSVLNEAYLSLKQEIEKIKSDCLAKVSTAQLEAKRSLIKKRAVIEQEIFEAARRKIIVFTETDDYKKLLLKYATQASKQIENYYCKVFLRPCDMQFANEVGLHFSKAEIAENSSIKLGGLIVKSDERHISLDYTLDYLFSQQKEYFKCNSGLYVE